MWKQVSLRIHQLCATHGYNINSLARKAGIPPTTLKNILYGNSQNPGVVTIKLICDGLGISLYDFFDTDAFKDTEREDLEPVFISGECWMDEGFRCQTRKFSAGILTDFKGN